LVNEEKKQLPICSQTRFFCFFFGKGKASVGLLLLTSCLREVSRENQASKPFSFVVFFQHLARINFSALLMQRSFSFQTRQ